jgi:hypothetical protein
MVLGALHPLTRPRHPWGKGLIDFSATYIEGTIKGFENWLNNPAITTIMPQSMLKEIQEKIWKIMIELIEFDAKHTSDFLNYIKDKEKISTIPSLLLREEKEERTPPYSL